MILSARQAARAALAARPPDNCSDGHWAEAMRGLKHFVDAGWSDKTPQLGWTAVELYRLPPLWSRIDLTGAAHLIGDRRVIAVSEDSIVIDTPSGAPLKFRRLSREHFGMTAAAIDCSGRLLCGWRSGARPHAGRLRVTGIDLRPQPNYCGDASQFDFIWASPPCQRFHRVEDGARGEGRREPEPDWADARTA